MRQQIIKYKNASRKNTKDRREKLMFKKLFGKRKKDKNETGNDIQLKEGGAYKARIKWDDREWLVLDKIEYQGIEYYYIIQDLSDEVTSFENLENYKGRISIEFIHKVDNGMYRNVTDQNLIDQLLAITGEKFLRSGLL